MIYISWLIFLAGLAVFIWMKRLDWGKSSLQVIHLPPVELNPVTRGKDGYFDQTRAYLVSGVMVAIATACAVGISLSSWEGSRYAPLIVGLIFAAWGGVVWIVIKKDIDVLHRHIEEQRAILTKLKSDPDGAHVPLPSLRRVTAEKIVFVSGTFYDFEAPTTLGFNSDVPSLEMLAHKEAALAIIKPRLLKLAGLSDSEWFEKDRARKV